MANSDKKSLWRYMPLAALLRLLQTRELYVARADAFEDILEGKFGLTALQKHLGIDLPESDQIIEALKRDCFLSCWHLSSAESLAMWRLYGKSDSSVAIVSNVGAVMSTGNDFCSNLEHCGMFGEVIYDNFVVDSRFRVATIGLPFGYRELPIPKSVQILFCKAPAFEYEKEWRLVIWRKKAAASSVGLSIPDFGKFIERIMISPEAQDWVVEAVRHTVHIRFGLKAIPVERSQLAVHFRP